MKKTLLSQTKASEIINAIAREYYSKNNISDGPLLPTTAKQLKSGKADNTFNRITGILGNNFIMSNIPNIIRAISYDYLKDSPLADKKFGFWKKINKSNGEQVIYENTPNGSERSGNIFTDLGLISDEPDTEIQTLVFDKNFAADMALNSNLQSWATLSGFAEWISERANNFLAALDKAITLDLESTIKNYLGYTPIAIDTTGLNKAEIAEAIESQIGTLITEIENNYTDYNSLKFDNVINPENVGLVFSTAGIVNRNINYLRKLYSPNEGAPLDWGVGHITTSNLDFDNEVLIIPDKKLVWNNFMDSMDTSLGFSYKTLKTFYTFWGSLIMESVPAFKIIATDAPATAIKAKMISKQTQALKIIENQIESLEKDLKDKVLDAAEVSIKKAALKEAKKIISKLNIDEYLEKLTVITPTKQFLRIENQDNSELLNSVKESNKELKDSVSELAKNVKFLDKTKAEIHKEELKDVKEENKNVLNILNNNKNNKKNKNKDNRK